MYFVAPNANEQKMDLEGELTITEFGSEFLITNIHCTSSISHFISFKSAKKLKLFVLFLLQ